VQQRTISSTPWGIPKIKNEKDTAEGKENPKWKHRWIIVNDQKAESDIIAVEKLVLIV